MSDRGRTLPLGAVKLEFVLRAAQFELDGSSTAGKCRVEVAAMKGNSSLEFGTRATLLRNLFVQALVFDPGINRRAFRR